MSKSEEQRIAARQKAEERLTVHNRKDAERIAAHERDSRAQDEKTARLRGLRLAKEAADRAAAPAAGFLRKKAGRLQCSKRNRFHGRRARLSHRRSRFRDAHPHPQKSPAENGRGVVAVGSPDGT
jgi:hypothetical protein